MRLISSVADTLPATADEVIDARGQVEAMHGVVVDKTDGHAALQAAMNSDSMVRRFVQAAPMAVCMYDKEMRVLMASESWLSERRAKEEEVLGRSMYDIMPWLPEKWRTIHRQVLRGDAMSHDRDPWERRSGKPGWLKWSAAPWRGPRRRPRPPRRRPG